jgi:protein-tyrosine phosphatase
MDRDDGRRKLIDPFTLRIHGDTYFTNETFSTNLISKIEGNLYQGGTVEGIALPGFFRHVISLYKWEQYDLNHELDSYTLVTAYDADVVPLVPMLDGLARLAVSCLRSGPTLIACKAGLNRSGLLSALALIEMGSSPSEAIELLRRKRCPQVLCNPSFEAYVLGQSEAGGATQ